MLKKRHHLPVEKRNKYLKRDSNPFKSSGNELLEGKMSNHPVPDHNRDMMREDFGTEYLISDPKSDKILREVVGDHKHDLKRQTLLHEQIRNDEDYDDWEYGTEPSYGKKV